MGRGAKGSQQCLGVGQKMCGVHVFSTVSSRPIEIKMHAAFNWAPGNYVEKIATLFPVACFTIPRNDRYYLAE